jgi:hypothetical protein
MFRVKLETPGNEPHNRWNISVDNINTQDNNLEHNTNEIK